MATSISINTLRDTNEGRDDFWNNTVSSDLLTQSLLKASTVKRILTSSKLGENLESNSVPFGKMNGTIADTQIATKKVYGSVPPSGKVQHIADRTIGPINLNSTALEFNNNGVGINTTAPAEGTPQVRLDVNGVVKINNATITGSSLTSNTTLTFNGGGTFGGKITVSTGGINASGDSTINGDLNVNSIRPRASGSATDTAYSFFGSAIQNNTGFYYNTNTGNAGVNLCIAGSDIISARAASVRFNKQTITVGSIGNRLVSSNTGVYNEFSGSGVGLRYHLRSSAEDSGFGNTSALTIMSIDPNTNKGFIGIGTDPDTDTNNPARLNVAGNIKASGNLILNTAVITSNATNANLSFNGGATFAGAVTLPNGDPPTANSAASKTYVDNKVPNIDLSNYLSLNGGTMTGNINVGGTVSPAIGRVNLSVGTASQAGYIEFRKADNTRIGLLGLNNATMNIECENGTGNRILNVVAADGLRCSGNITAFYSDERLKTFLGKIPNALDKINRISGYYFKENDKAKSLGYSNDKIQVGVNAQEIEKVIPEIVSLAPVDTEVNERGETVSKSGENIKTVSYEKLVPLLIEAIKELSSKVNYLESKLNN